MKTKSLLSIAAICLAMVFSFSSCDEPQGPEQPNPETPSDDNPGDGGGGGQQTAAADIFKAFDKVGNQFWYQWYLSGSYQAYSGRKTYKSAKCVCWEVTSVSGNTAKVNVYDNFDFDNPTQMTFTRDADGSLLMNNKKVTNTQSPEFYLMSFGKNGSYEWKELYSNGEYTNIFYTKSNGYTSVDNTIDISETWNSYGLAGSQESEFTNADAGSSTMTFSLKRAQTAYVSKSASKPSGISLTNIEDYTISSHQYIQNNPDATGWEVSFTHNSANTWGYAIGMYMNDGNWYPCYRINDISDYVKSFNDKYDNWGKGGDLLCDPITDFSTTSHTYYFFLTPKAMQLGKTNGTLSFCIFALGWGPDLISTIDGSTAAFNINFSESGMPARRISNNRELRPAPLSVR